MTGDLVPVHGGLDDLVDRSVPLSERKALVAEAAKLPTLRVSRADLSTLYRIGDGALSPLEGPMREAVWHRVLDERVILSRGRRYAWTHPARAAGHRRRGARAPRGAARSRCATRRASWSAIVDDVEVFDWDKARYVAARLRHASASTTPAAAWSSPTRARSSSAASSARCRSPRTPSTASTCSRRA